MSAEYDEMTVELMREVADTDTTFQAIFRQMTPKEIMIYLFRMAHDRELSSIKDLMEAELESRHAEDG